MAADPFVGRVVYIVGVFNGALAADAACYRSDTGGAGDICVVGTVGNCAAVYVCGNTANIVCTGDIYGIPRVGDRGAVEVCDDTGGVGLTFQCTLNTKILYFGSRAADIAK